MTQLPGLDPAWSRHVDAPDAEGVTRRWHVLERAGTAPEHTLLCVHGNPTWSYLWRRVLTQAPPTWRVVAVDQLGMGWSDRPDTPRTLAQRIEDLDRLTAALDITGPVSLLAHDWGGVIGLGWAQRHRDRLESVVLTNTAVHQPHEDKVPAFIRFSRASHLLARMTRLTPAFVRATTSHSIPPLPRDVRDAFAQPYASAARRDAVAQFVRDIPLEETHPSRRTLDQVGAGLSSLAQVPTLMVWGMRDPVFQPRYLNDLLRRMPHADVQRYPRAGHLVLEDAPEAVGVIWDWLQEPHEPPPAAPRTLAPVPIAVDVSRPHETAVVELAADRRITFAQLDERVLQIATGLVAWGVRRGDRVALLVPPGIDLTVLAYALWRIGAVVVVADAGLGLRRLGAALRSAGPQHLIGVARGVRLADLTHVPGRRMIVSEDEGLDELASDGRAAQVALPAPETITGTDDAAVLFTSGATGPPKGVVYSRDGLGNQVALIRETVDLQPGERFVAAFAPFALYGPALGLTSVVPDIDVTRPHTLTAAGLARAVEAVDATVIFAAPAAIRTVVTTGDRLDAHQREVLGRPRTVLSAGAPVPASLVQRLREVLPSARSLTPYGMTEALPLTMVDPTEVDEGTGEPGVCVGRPVAGVTVRIAPLDAAGVPAQELTDAPGITGEIVARGPHLLDRYDRALLANRASRRPDGWHRTGDVGHLDARGRLWVEGRLAHVVSTPDGPVTPYAVEARLTTLPEVADAAVVGVGPPGAQQVVAIVVPPGRFGPVSRRLGAPPGHRAMAPPEVATRVRRVAGLPISAVLQRDSMPVDVRHASKVDRTALARWADGLLHGRTWRARIAAVGRTSAPHTRSR